MMAVSLDRTASAPRGTLSAEGSQRPNAWKDRALGRDVKSTRT